MRSPTHIIPLLILVLFVYSGNASQRVVSNAVPRGWTPSILHKRGSLGDYEIQVTVALAQRNLQQLESEFWAVSDPQNINYGRYKSFHEVVELVAPSRAAISHITNYFNEKGIESRRIVLHSSRDFMTVSMTVAQAEDIFQTAYEPYVHAKTGNVAVGMSESYFLEERISSHIDFVSRFSKISVLKETITAAAETATKVLRATAAASNTPYIVYPWADNAGVYVRIIFFCPDGSVPAISGNATVGSVVGCGATNITSATLSGVSQLTNNTLFTEVVNLGTLTVRKCSDLNDSCLLIAQANSFPIDAAYVGIYVRNTTIPVYVPYVVQAFVTYSDNTTSTITQSNVVEASDIASPSFAHALYSVKSSPIVKSATNNQSVVQYEGESFSPSDLQKFFQFYQIPDYSNLVQVVHPENNDISNPGGEGTLDIQTIMGVAQNSTTIFWANNNTGSTIDDHLSWITELLNQPTSPLVISLSYGNSEGNDYARDYVTRTNYEFMKAGLRGITLIYCSMDNGAGSPFDPVFPAGSPYVTSVGGTQLYSKADSTCFSGDTYTCTPEEVVSSVATGSGITGGGGFSNIFPRPSYQDSVVIKYLPSLQGLTGFNSSNRAYPDVSTIAHNAPIFIGGSFGLEDGTSASAPFFAGLVTLLNDLRLQNGNAQLGFLNPFIYSLNDTAFNDIVRGNNNCTEFLCYPIGYTALPGYDAASGRGSPRFDQWAAAVLALPATNSTNPTPAPSSSSTSSTTGNSTSSTSTTSTTATSGASKLAWISVFILSFIALC